MRWHTFLPDFRGARQGLFSFALHVNPGMDGKGEGKNNGANKRENEGVTTGRTGALVAVVDADHFAVVPRRHRDKSYLRQ